MLIIGFMEGALPERGGLGLLGPHNILRALAERGHEVAIAACGACTPGQEKYLAATVVSALARKQGAGSFGVVLFRAAKQWAFGPSMLWRLNRHVRRADFVSLHSLYSFPVLAGYLLARLHGVPYGVWPHGVLAAAQRRVSPRKKRVYEAVITKWMLKTASVVFFSAAGETTEGAELVNGTPGVIIPDGIDVSEFKALPPRGGFRSRYVGGHDGPLIVCIGRLNAKKGLDLLIRAIARTSQCRKNVRLVIIGPADPPRFREQVTSWIKEAGMEAIAHVTAAISPTEKLQALADADVFVSTSEAENFGFAIFEAMACGVPVVVSDTLHYAEEIRRRQAGFVVPRTAQSFAEAVVSLLDDEGLRHRMGANGRSLAKTVSLEETGAKLEKTIQSVVEGRPLPPDLVSAVDVRA